MTLVLNNINKTFGSHNVIENLNLTIPKGEVFGFLGPNGAGKTTTMRMILDIIKPDSGEISWEGRPINLETVKSFGYLPEERGLYPKMQVYEQMLFFARLRGLDSSAAKKEIAYWIERFKLESLIRKKANELSKGNQQKIQFILAILHKPQLLIMDEPFSGLDPVNVELLKEAFIELAKQGRTIMFSSHRLEHIEELCSLLCILKDGKVLVKGTVKEVKRSTGRKIIRLGIFGSLNFLGSITEHYLLKESQEEAGKGMFSEVEFDLPEGTDPQRILQEAIRNGEVRRFEMTEPSLNEIFIQLVGGSSR